VAGVATLTKCPKCRRTYLVFGKPCRSTVVWICPRCKRGRNLPGDQSD